MFTLRQNIGAASEKTNYFTFLVPKTWVDGLYNPYCILSPETRSKQGGVMNSSILSIISVKHFQVLNRFKMKIFSPALNDTPLRDR